jgi:putative transferase (TIGR04331 family)
MVRPRQELFLATTALEEFWDTSKPILFLSEACLRYSRREFWKNLNYQIFRSPLDDKVKYREAYNQIVIIYEKLLIVLSKKLNALHGVEKSIKFWRIFMGPWLMHYIHILYERYVSIESVLSNYPDITTIGLSLDEFVIPRDFSNFFERIFGDEYNLQIYTKILSLLDKDFSVKKINVKQQLFEECYKTTQNNIIKKFLKKIIKNFSSFVIKNAYFPSPIVEREIFIKTKGKVFFDHFNSFKLPELTIDFEMRNRLAREIEKIRKKSFIESVLIKILPLEIPRSYLEGFNILNRNIQNWQRPKVIATSESWYFDELFKLWAANCSEEGTTLVGIQHGSNYGIAEILPHEDHELKISSRFYSWGWRDERIPTKIKPLPAPRLMNHKIIVADNKKTGILFIQKSIPRYFFGFHDFRNYDITNYFDWQRRFYNSIAKDIQKKIKVRIYPVDYGCDCKERWYDLDKTIQMEEISIPFLKSLKNCRLSVHDHLGNTFLESLFVNKPTILFWDPNIFTVRSEAYPFFEKLKDAGILFYCPEEAANTVNSIYSDVESWWLSPVRQKARENICNQFAVSSDDAVNMWASEFINILRNKK